MHGYVTAIRSRPVTYGGAVSCDATIQKYEVQQVVEELCLKPLRLQPLCPEGRRCPGGQESCGSGKFRSDSEIKVWNGLETNDLETKEMVDGVLDVLDDSEFKAKIRKPKT